MVVPVSEEPPGFPEPVVASFEVVDTIEKLEALRWLHAERDRAHAAAELARTIGTDQDTIDDALRELAEAGLLTRDGGGGYWYAPTRHDLDDAIGALVRLYGQDRLRVLRAITMAALHRIRSSAAKTFR
jgi:DNA-binding transcriptional ArsR family regulator